MPKFLLSHFVSLLLFSSSFAQNDVPTAINGFLDLRNWEFQTDGPVKLDGEWEFYWKQLLTPEELDSAPSGKTLFLFPQLWNNGELNGERLNGSGYATYALTVALPSQHPPLSLSVEDFFSSYSLYVNGTLFSSNGKVTTSPDTYEPSWVPLTKPLRAESDTLRLVLLVANFDHYKGGSSQSMVLGAEEDLNLKREQELAYGWILAGSMFMGGLFFFGLYLFGRHDKAMLFFSLFCLVYSYRNIGSDLYAINTLVQEIPWWLVVRLEYVCVFLSLILFTEYLISLYPEEIHIPTLRTYNWINISLMLFSIAGPVKLFTTILPYYLIILLAAIFYAAYVVIMAALHHREGAVYAVAAKSAVFAIISYNILVYFGLTPRLIIFNFIAHLIFFFCQSLILSFRFASSLTRAKEAAEHASRAKSEFLSTMSHEMRTPLNAVIGMTNFLMDDSPKKEQMENLQTLKFSAEHLMMLINDVLDYSKIESGKIDFVSESVAIRQMISQVVKVHEKKARDKGLQLRWKVAPAIPARIVCDKMRMVQVISNLVDNAVKFTQKGAVEVNVSLQEQTDEMVKLLFEVTDTGIGIEPSKHALIFESFSQANASTTREFGGSGLGLTITRRLLQLQGSDIALSSEPGVGSRFYFTQWFKFATDTATTSDLAKGPAEDKPLSKKRILVVEDNQVNVLVVKKFLSKWGADVEVAANGQIAVDKVRAEAYDLVLMDLQMPVMDGYEATILIREMNSEIPIIAITASVLMDVQERIYKAGMSNYVTKPFVPDDLLAKLKKHLAIDG